MVADHRLVARRGLRREARKNPRPLRVNPRLVPKKAMIRVYPRQSATREAKKNPRPFAWIRGLVTKRPDPRLSAPIRDP
jgi:hypothetical protein